MAIGQPETNAAGQQCPVFRQCAIRRCSCRCRMSHECSAARTKRNAFGGHDVSSTGNIRHCGDRVERGRARSIHSGAQRLRAADGRLSVGDCVEGQESVLPFPATAPIASLSANTQRRSERHNTRSLQFRSAGNRPGVMPPQWTKDRRAPRRASRDGG